MCELDLPLKFAQKLYNEFAIRHPNAFYLRTRQRGMQNWDGKIHYITKTGQFKIGLLPKVYDMCIEMGIKPKVVDMRQPLPKVSKVVTNIGKYKLRPEQEKAVKAVINNKIGNTPFHIGVLDYTVNAGKTLIMSSLYLSYKKQLKTLLITNDSDWLNQAREEFKQYQNVITRLFNTRIRIG